MFQAQERHDYVASSGQLVCCYPGCTMEGWTKKHEIRSHPFCFNLGLRSGVMRVAVYCRALAKNAMPVKKKRPPILDATEMERVWRGLEPPVFSIHDDSRDTLDRVKCSPFPLKIPFGWKVHERCTKPQAILLLANVKSRACAKTRRHPLN